LSSIDEMKAHVKFRLAEPIAHKPSDDQILLNLTTQIQSYLNQVNLSAKPWATGECLLYVQPNQEDYALNAANFGKPIQVRTVYPQNSAHVERIVDFFELGDLNFDWNLPKNFGNLVYNADGSPHTAFRMAFFRKLGTDVPWVRVIPVPQWPATYQILYQIGVYGDTQGLGTVPVLPQHHALIEVRTAMSLLPIAEWSADELANAKKRQELALSLGNDEKRLGADFYDYIKTVTISRRLNRRGAAFTID
jgi:hypothetical protein